MANRQGNKRAKGGKDKKAPKADKAAEASKARKARKARKADKDLIRPEAEPVPMDKGEVQKAAKDRLKRAEKDLRRLERKERRGERRTTTRDRSVDRRLRRIETALGRPVWPLLVTVLGLNAAAASIAVFNFFRPGEFLDVGVLIPDAGHWEYVSYLVIAAGVATALALGLSPTVDFQRRARIAFAYYISTAIVVASVGLLIAMLLAPIEEIDVDLGQLAWWLAIATAVTSVAAGALYIASFAGRLRLFFHWAYHLAMGILMAVSVCGALVLGIVVAADLGIVFELGLGLAVAAAVGVLFTVPALMATMLMEGALEQGAAGS